MFLRAAAVSVGLLLASRVLGLVRESAQAAAFGASGAGDVAALMLTLPDWVAGVLASGGLAYALLPAWARQGPRQVAASQRRVARALLALGLALGLALALGRHGALALLASGLPPSLQPAAAEALLWCALALPGAFLAALWSTRLQAEGDFLGLYASNLVVNLLLIATLVGAATSWRAGGVGVQVGLLGAGLLAAVGIRLGWLQWRQGAIARRMAAQADAARDPAEGCRAALPALPVWGWAVAAAGLPLVLPFAARSMASEAGPGALATFNYAWKLVELPLLLAVQLVGTLALGPISRAFARGAQNDAALAIRRGLALAWTLACAAVAGLLLAAPAVAQLLFGWGRMEPQALAHIAGWGRLGAWSLLPQALLTIAVAVLAAQARLRAAVFAYAVALLALLASGAQSGGVLMLWLVGVLAAVALALLWAARVQLRGRMPWAALVAAAGALAAIGLVAHWVLPRGQGVATQLAWGALGVLLVVASAWAASADLRAALRR